MGKAHVLYLVIPCYNEQEVLPETEKRLTTKLKSMIAAGLISENSRIVFVDDGSRDRTWEIISKMHGRSDLVEGIKLSRNRGHQNALLAGLMTVKGDCDITISMDADLQDDIEVLDDFISKYNEGCEIVYGVRNARKTDSLFKRATAQGFYRLMRRMGVEVVYNHADYRLMSRRALDELENFKEVNLFLRGLIPMIGFKTGTVEYGRGKRFAGKSKYPLRKMFSFAEDGITSLSIKPIRMISAFGILIFLVSICLMIFFIHGALTGQTVQGWASTVVSVWGLGGLQLFAIGIIGEYIGKIYLETKNRPRFIIEERLQHNEEKNLEEV